MSRANNTFKITLSLATPFVMSRTRLTLDGLLSAAVFRKTGLKGQDCVPHIPLEQEKGIFKASSLFIDEDSRLAYVQVGRTMSLKKTADLSTKHFLPNSANGSRYLAVDQARGKYKSNMTSYSALSASKVCFYGKGDAEAVKELIENYIVGIGTHGNTGYGQIINVEYELLDDSDMSYWVTPSGLPARPIPVDAWKALDGASKDSLTEAANVTVRFPYWDKENRAQAVFPIEHTYF